MRINTVAKHLMITILFLASFQLIDKQLEGAILETNAGIKEGEFTVQINGLRLWYKVSGKGPVCMIPTPGHGPSSDLYFTSFSPLEEIFTMVYLDTRGSGRSEHPELTEYNMRNFAADLEGVRRHLGVNKIWLMGHSNGGKIVLNYAFRYSDSVQGLILVETKLETPSRGEGISQRMQLRKAEPWFEAAMEAWARQPKSQAELEENTEATLPFFFSSIENLDKHKEVFRHTSLSFHARQGMRYWEKSPGDLVSWLPEMDIPALIIVGADDFITPPLAAQVLHREIKNSKLLVIEKAGHFPWLEEPEQFFDGIRDFLPKLGYRAN